MICLWHADCETSHIQKMAEYCYVQTHRSIIRQRIDYWSTRLAGKLLQANIMKTNLINNY